jgi:hypothetical protein
MGRKFHQGFEEIKTFWRMGVKEARNIFYADSPISRESDPALWANLTPQEAFNVKKSGRSNEPSRALVSPRDSPRTPDYFESQQPYLSVVDDRIAAASRNIHDGHESRERESRQPEQEFV